ncbi:hypothetical protein EU545_05175 [Candidatus Thorarchaeota archaeon]|nr:MAG: hypothetical protein EU545_05175 [Candidatus Thorarchaeota archaeon]
MEFRLRINGPGFEVYLFNQTIWTETLRPEIDIIEPAVVNRPGGDLVRLDNETSWLTVNLSDPTGVLHSTLVAVYTNATTGQPEYLLLSDRAGIVSGVPTELEVPLEAVLRYAQLTNQTNEDTIEIATLLQVTDLVGMSTQRSLRIQYTLRHPYRTETDILDFLQGILPTVLTGVGSMMFLSLLVFYVKTQRENE